MAKSKHWDDINSWWNKRKNWWSGWRDDNRCYPVSISAAMWDAIRGSTWKGANAALATIASILSVVSAGSSELSLDDFSGVTEVSELIDRLIEKSQPDDNSSLRHLTIAIFYLSIAGDFILLIHSWLKLNAAMYDAKGLNCRHRYISPNIIPVFGVTAGLSMGSIGFFNTALSKTTRSVLTSAGPLISTLFVDLSLATRENQTENALLVAGLNERAEGDPEPTCFRFCNAAPK
mgnify:CR=1 FL=1